MLGDRYVIRWFGYDILDSEIITEADYQHWARCLERLALSMGLCVERLGSAIDIIIAKKFGSVSPKEFYSFQWQWDGLNERLGISMSGALWLHNENGERGDFPSWEGYRHGKRIFGDSIGRPHRHSLEVIRHRRERARGNTQ